MFKEDYVWQVLSEGVLTALALTGGSASQHNEVLIGVRGATLSIGSNVLLHPVSFDIHAGRSVALIGHNGSGKSTLLKLMGRQANLTAGTISFKGKSLHRWDARDFARRLAYLPQHPPAAPGMLVRELVELGRYPWHGALGRFGTADRRKVTEAVEITGLAGLAGRVVDTLSGGERQRAWLAMLVAQDAECILLDEPISALDVRHQLEVLSLARELSRLKGVTVVTVLHDVNLAARFFDEILALRAGKLIARGTPEQIMRAERLRHIYDVDMEIIPQSSTGRLIAVAR